MNASSKLHKKGENPTTFCNSTDQYISNSMTDHQTDNPKNNSMKSKNRDNLAGLESEQPQNPFKTECDEFNCNTLNSNGNFKHNDVK